MSIVKFSISAMLALQSPVVSHGPGSVAIGTNNGSVNVITPRLKRPTPQRQFSLDVIQMDKNLAGLRADFTQRLDEITKQYPSSEASPAHDWFRDTSALEARKYEFRRYRTYYQTKATILFERLLVMYPGVVKETIDPALPIESGPSLFDFLDGFHALALKHGTELKGHSPSSTHLPATVQ